MLFNRTPPPPAPPPTQPVRPAAGSWPPPVGAAPAMPPVPAVHTPVASTVVARTPVAPTSENTAETSDEKSAGDVTPMALTGVSTLAEVMADVEIQVESGNLDRFIPLATGFHPLDEVLNGGLRRSDLFIIGGPGGVGKTIFSLQLARNVVVHNPDATAMYVCYEHDRTHLLMRLLCMENAECGLGEQALTFRKLNDMAQTAAGQGGLVNMLRHDPRYARVIAQIDTYANRLHLVKASGTHTTLDQLDDWAHRLSTHGEQSLLVVDYLQKIPVDYSKLTPELEVTTYLAQGLKELAMVTGLRIVAISASDTDGLKSKRMRFRDMRGSTAIQYEADVGVVLNNKWQIVSREHLVYNPMAAEQMRDLVVMTIEKNRSGRAGVDMEFTFDASHFRWGSRGNYVHDRLIDDRITLQ